MNQTLRLINGGRLPGAAGAVASSALGAVHSATHSPVTSNDVTTELTHRGYKIVVAPAPVHHAPAPSAPQLTKTMAINVAIDEALEKMELPRTRVHPFRCPTSNCGISAAQWNALVNWCVTVANGYLVGTYGLPAWARTALAHGSLRGTLSGTAGLGALSDWIQENSWLVTAVGSTISAYGEHLTAANIKQAIKDNAAKAFSKEDATALLAALQQSNAIPAGKQGTVAAGANAATSSGWMMPALVVAGVVVAVLVLKK